MKDMMIAHSAMNFVKSRTSAGCINLWSRSIKQSPVHYDYACNALEYIRSHRGSGVGCTMSEFLQHARRVEIAQAGNCMEQVALTCLYLSRLPKPPKYNAVYLMGGDHCFVVLNQPADKENFYSPFFKDWSEDAIIIDVWASICCKARDYIHQWESKFFAMARENGHFLTPAGWIPTDDKYFLHCLKICKKRSFIRPNSKVALY